MRLYVSLLYHFENLVETMNVNLVASVLDVMESATSANVYEIVELSQREKLILNGYIVIHRVMIFKLKYT